MEQLQRQLTTLALRRSYLKDQIEVIERSVGAIQFAIKVLQEQESNGDDPQSAE